jgi:hypothetical protein
MSNRKIEPATCLEMRGEVEGWVGRLSLCIEAYNRSGIAKHRRTGCPSIPLLKAA